MAYITGGGPALVVPKPAKATPTPASVATGTPKKTVVAPPFAGYLTPAQQAAQAAAQARASILPQQQAIAAAQAADAAAAKRQATDTTGYYAALANVLKGIAPAVNTGYSNAAGADSAFSKGFTDGLAHVQAQAGQTNNDVLGVSGGQVQAGQVAQQTGGTGIQDALYGLTGYAPAAGLEREGAAFGAAAAQQPATAAGYGGQQLNRLTQQELLNQQAFGQQKVDLAAQIPGLRQTALNQIIGQQNTLTGQHNTALNNAATAKNNAAKLKIQQDALKTAKDYHDQQLGLGIYKAKTAAAAQSDLAAYRKAQIQVQSDHNKVMESQGYTKLQLATYNAQTSRMRAQAAKKPKGLTALQWTNTYQDADKRAETLYWGVPPKSHYDAGQGKWVYDDQSGTPQVPYLDALAKMKTEFPSLTATKIKQIVDSNYPPGAAGRPTAFGLPALLGG